MLNAQRETESALAADQVQLFLALGGGWENTHAAHGEHGAKHGEEHAGAQDEHEAQSHHAG